ncbi:putative serine protease [Podospora australis]|uniref:Serine protease n=1 Tax=Podospora australis TaxID=1536484 RepID=A0AAN6WQH9_9PEZI|nr:putative serine protease [Podospora australis]
MSQSLRSLALWAFANIAVHAILPPPLVPHALNAPRPLQGSHNEGTTTFQQLTDHGNHDLGTFPVRYWWDTTFWEGPGSPIVVFSPGETAADYYTGFLDNSSIVGLYAQAIGAATIVLEHRYWGESVPFKVFDTKNLTYLNLDNSIQDLVHFAKTVNLPFDDSGKSNAPAAPWILVGGSYAGALAAWVEKLSPGTFWAYHASSAPVEVIRNFWQYFQPIHEGMPKNCSADLVAITNHVDNVLQGGSEAESKALKDMFGLGNLTHPDDVASAIGAPVFRWQDILPWMRYPVFYQMCDTIEGARPVVTDYDNGTKQFFTEPTVGAAPITSIGLEKALVNYAAWFRYEFLPDHCSNQGYPEWSDPLSTGCFDSHNKTHPLYSDMSYTSPLNRQWLWMTCNEPLFYWQTGAPPNESSLISRLVTPEYCELQCKLAFPEQDGVTYGAARALTEKTLNDRTGGWFTNTTRVIWVNGEFDPWRSASVSSEYRPGGPQNSTRETPVHLIPGGRHCDDLGTINGEYGAGVKRAQVESVAKMVEWVGEFYDAKLKEQGQR